MANKYFCTRLKHLPVDEIHKALEAILGREVHPFFEIESLVAVVVEHAPLKMELPTMAEFIEAATKMLGRPKDDPDTDDTIPPPAKEE